MHNTTVEQLTGNVVMEVLGVTAQLRTGDADVPCDGEATRHWLRNIPTTVAAGTLEIQQEHRRPTRPRSPSANLIANDVDLIPTDEQALLIATARDFVAWSADAHSVRSLEESELGYDAAEWATMVDLGWAELEPLELAFVADELGRGAVPTPLVVTAPLRNALPGLATTLPPDAIVTLAAIVPGAVNEFVGSHPIAEPALTATYVLVPYANRATTVVAATRDGLACIDQLDEGCVLTREHVVGGDPMFQLVCNRVGAEPIAGKLHTVLDHLAIAALVYATGAAEGALNLSVQHAKDRHQLGRPVGSFQAVAHRCADMRAEVDACRVLGQRAAWALARGEDSTYEVSAALGYAKDALRRVAMHAHQVHGAIGFSTEHDLHLFTRRIQGVRAELRQHGVASGTVRGRHWASLR